MQNLTEGIDAYQAGQYTEALEYFRRALPGVRIESERERVLMWIACSSLAVGNRSVLLDACSQLLGSTEGEIRRFARFGLRQYGLEHPAGSRARGRGRPGAIVGNAVRLYFAQFWPLMGSVCEAMAWMVGLGLATLVWTAFVLARVHLGPVSLLGTAQALWSGTLLVVPLGAGALLVLDRLLGAFRSQWQTIRGALDIPTLPVQPLALAPAILAMGGVVAGCAQWHWGAAVIAALLLEPWCLCLYGSAQCGRTRRLEE